ncbi:hypothetical protein N2602_02740 [Bradyrhizobium sp. NC92]|nr:hypothetical protein [Bradyrhizobium sp. NC92]UWU69465.1 hypothetical protein N2602_02740 [Bradyrhizobium sp. NC92]
MASHPNLYRLTNSLRQDHLALQRARAMMHDVSELPLLQSALSEALVITGQKLGNIQLIDWKTGHLEIMAQQGFSEDFLDCFRRVTIRDGCAAVVRCLTGSPSFSMTSQWISDFCLFGTSPDEPGSRPCNQPRS